jgi:periplasmic protein TonB
MAPTLKEPEQKNSSVPSSPVSAAQPKVQPVALEISVTVNGARTVEGSDKREPFSETTQTVLVFGNGAVIRLNSGVTAGQLLFLTNEKTKKEVVCQVVKSKNYSSVSGYVELEFTEPAVGFWGMRFPSDRVVPSPVPASGAPAPVSPTKPVLPAAQAKPVVPPPSTIAPPPAPTVAAIPVRVAPPVEKRPESPVAATSGVASLIASTPADSPSEELKKQAARLQERLSSMHFSETPTTPPKADTPILQLDAIAISEETAKIFELATPGTAAPVLNAGPALARPANPAELLNTAPVARHEKAASWMNEEEVKIPAWLEPLARNAAASTPTVAPPAAPPILPPAPPQVTPVTATIIPPSAPEVDAIIALPPGPAPLEVTELEDAQVAGESYEFGAKTEAALAPVGEAPAPNFGTSLFESNDSVYEEPASGGSKKGLWIAAIAATILLAAGGGWWYLQQTGHAAAGSTATTSQTESPALQVAAQSQPQQSFGPAPASTTDKSFSIPGQVITQTANKTAPSLAPATDVQRISASRDTVKSTPTSAASRAAEPVAEPAEPPKKSAFSHLRLAAPTVKGGKAQAISSEGEPGIVIENSANLSAAPLSAGLAGSKGNQPAAPIPVGGEVTNVQLISSVPPAYPLMARSQRISGDVKIDALIDESGRVTGMKVVTGPAMLHQAAMDALRQWKYKPATLNGKPVSMHLMVTIQFRLQ